MRTLLQLVTLAQAYADAHPAIAAVAAEGQKVLDLAESDETVAQKVQAIADDLWPIVEPLFSPGAMPVLAVFDVIERNIGKLTQTAVDGIGTAVADLQATQADPGTAQSLPADAPAPAAKPWPKGVPSSTATTT